MKTIESTLLAIYVFKITLGEVQAPVGIKACKNKCLRQADCLAIIYDALHIACEIRFLHDIPSKPKKPSIIILRRDLPRSVTQYCKVAPCKNGFCIVTRSHKEICFPRSTSGCHRCQHPPNIQNAGVSVSHSLHGALAKYTCNPNFSYDNRRTWSLRCFRNCTWETNDLQCRRITSVPSKGTQALKVPKKSRIKLPTPLKDGTSVEVCGKIRTPNEFNINFKKSRINYVHIHSWFFYKKKSGKPTKQLLINSCVGSKRSKEIRAEGDKFPFSWNTEFCLTVTRNHSKYRIVIQKETFFIPDIYKGAARMVYAKLVELTKAEMKKP